MDVFKVSSSDLNNLPFIEELCNYNKPILLSTGAAYLWEIQRTVELIENNGNALGLMHCVLNYPTLNKNANLGMIKDLQHKFPRQIIGYSDHTLPNDMDVCLHASILGAEIIEKHFTFDKTLEGNDHYHAMDVYDLKNFNSKVDSLFTTLGSFVKKPLETENVSRLNARRSLVAKNSISKGKIIEYNDLTWKRPGNGIGPEYIKSLIGMQSLLDIDEDTVLQFNMFRK